MKKEIAKTRDSNNKTEIQKNKNKYLIVLLVNCSTASSTFLIVSFILFLLQNNNVFDSIHTIYGHTKIKEKKKKKTQKILNKIVFSI